ncbi:MAG: hypothetical protein RSI33_08745 [Clostridia bacterium]
MEGIRQVDAWTEKKLLEADNVYMTEHMRPVDAWTDLDLINKVDDWDIAIVLMDADDKLEALDHAGLLYDFSQNTV